MTKCYLCNGTLKETTDLVMYKNKTVPIHVEKCDKCGEIFTDPKESERVRLEIHPPFFKKIKNFLFEDDIKILDFFKGKVL